MENYLNKKDQSSSNLALGLFAYRTTASICEKTLKDDTDEGSIYYIDLLHFIVSQYKRIIRSNFKSSIDVKLRAYELKTFVFRTMVEDLIVLIARNFGTEELSEVFRKELDMTKI